LAPIAAVALAGTAAVALEPDEIFGDPALEACTRSISTGFPCLIWTISACLCGSGSTQVTVTEVTGDPRKFCPSVGFL
jgi:hypothetical protein